MTTTFENAKVGDKVYSPTSGWGEITYISKSEIFHDYPICVRFQNKPGEGYEFTFEGYYYKDVPLQSLFWDEVTINAPSKPIRTKVINGIEIPDITITPVNGDHCYIPFPTHPDLCLRIYFLYSSELDDHIINNDLCYPDTEAGKSAAILHSKAMLKR
jgi:hypothetical protein